MAAFTVAPEVFPDTNLEVQKIRTQLRDQCHGRPAFYVTGPHPLLWTGSRAGREIITVTAIPNRLEYCVIFTVYTQFTIVDAAV
jgi:hypothetical protein